MKIGVTLFVITILIIAIWIIIELKRARHKIFAIFLIILILFTYISFSVVVKDKNIDLKSVQGVIEAGKLYFVWLGHTFGNVKTITANAIKMDWKGNETASEK